MLLLSSLMMFAACALGVFALAAALGSNVLRRRLARLASTPLSSSGAISAADHGLLDEGQGWMVRALAPLAGSASKNGSAAFEHMRLRLVRAGYRRDSAVVLYLGGRLLLTAVLPLLAWFSPLRLYFPPGFELFAPAIAAAIGYIGPSMWIDLATSRRQDTIDRDLPAALDLMVVCIEAGLGLMQSLARVGTEFRRVAPILAAEFELVTLESLAGKSNADALRGLARRTGVREVSVLVAMLTQTERFGTSLAGALRVHCDTMRTKRMQRAEEHAAKAPLKMLFPTALILLALLGLILGLAILRASAVLGS